MDFDLDDIKAYLCATCVDVHDPAVPVEVRQIRDGVAACQRPYVGVVRAVEFRLDPQLQWIALDDLKFVGCQFLASEVSPQGCHLDPPINSAMTRMRAAPSPSAG